MPEAPFTARLRRLIAHALLACAALAASALHAQGLEATFNTPDDIPLTVPSYTASGTVTLTLGFAPQPGTNLTVIQNTGLPFIDGQFTNLPNGSTINLTHNGTTYPFVAWYYGGDGNNDLVLLWPFTKLAAWGDNQYGQLGDGSTVNRRAPVNVSQSGPLVGKTIVQVANGGTHSLALCSDGTVAAWGLNMTGQIGDGSTTNRLLPVAVNVTAGTSALAGKTVISVAAGSGHSLALCSDGTVAAWGYNGNGQVGHDDPGSSPAVPVNVSMAEGRSALFGKSVVFISAGAMHSLALCSDGTVVAWGDNVKYQVLGGYGIRVYAPVRVHPSGGALSGKSVIAVTAGGQHNLALCSDGTVAAWGEHSYGQLGNNAADTVAFSPVVVNTANGTSALFGKTVVALAAGYSHSLALCSDGTVAAWGANGNGQLGDNSMAQRPAPVAVNVADGTSALSGKTVVALAASSSHSLALCSDGTVAGWGSNFIGQLGNTSSTNFLVPVNVNTETGVSVLAGRQVSGLATGVIGSYSLAIYGTTMPEIEVEVLEPSVTALTDQVSTVDFGTTLAVGRTFRVSNTGGQALQNVSVSITGADAASFTVLKQPSPLIYEGATSTFLVAFTGQSLGPKSAMLEITSNDSDELPFRVALMGTKTATLTAGFATAADTPLSAPYIDLTGAAVNLTLGFVPTPGTNLTLIKNTGLPFIEGQFTNLPNGSTLTLSYAGTSYPFIAWYYGGEGNNDLVLLWPHTGLAAWGKNDYGQLGDNTFRYRSTPKSVPQLGVLQDKTIVQVTRGYSHNLALCSDGTVAAWGDNNYGQLGNSSDVMTRVPVAVNVQAGTSALAGKTVVSVAAGLNYSLALCNDGTVAAWGHNHTNQLGGGTLASRALVPFAVNRSSGYSALAGKKVVALAAGSYHVLALCSDGTVVAWGAGSSGQIGDGYSFNRSTPVAVKVTAGTSALAGKSVIAVAAGTVHSLALCSDGTLAAWGDNDFGQLGINSLGDTYAPVAVNVAPGTSALAGKAVVGIAAGGFHSLALCSDGTVAGWGQNNAGQLGDNSLIDRQAPVAVNVTPGTSALAGKTVGTIAAGQSHSLALCSDGTVAAWGLHFYGQLGENSTATHRPAPVAVNVEAGTSVLAGRLVSALSLGSVAEHSVVIYGNGVTPSVTPSLMQKQTITFAPPASVYLGQSPLVLSANASSGRTVTLSVLAVGTTAAGASIVGKTLSFTGTGTIKVQAVQAGSGPLAAAPTVVKTITVKANPTALTLVNLTQTYTGTPRAISTLGGSGTVTVEYKMGTAFGSTAPTDAGSYPVRATDSKGTKTGTLVIAKAPLYVIPADQRRFVGQDNPPLTLSYSGWVNGESASQVTTAPVLKTTAKKTSPGGVYPITASGGVASPNYTFIYQTGALVVDSFAGSYEALLKDGGSGRAIGKLTLTVTAANTSFTGKLYYQEEKTALSLNGPLVTNPTIGSVAGSASVTSGGIPYVVSITALINGTLYANVTRGGSAYADTSTGRRLLAGQTIPYSGAHTAVLEPATPAANGVPAGAGWATAKISTKGLMTLVGRLGDGTSFTTSLTPDDASDPTYRLWLQPYKTGSATRLQSYFGGALTLLPHPALVGRRYVQSAALSWAKADLTSDVTYSAGFGPVSTVLMLDPWLPPATGITLADHLGLTNSSFEVLHSDTGSTLNGNLPTRVGLSTANTVSVTTPAANTTKWKATLVPATGLFSGSFELADTTPKPRVVPFTGVLRQPASTPDALIGDGHYLLPPLTGSAKTTGEIMFKRP